MAVTVQGQDVRRLGQEIKKAVQSHAFRTDLGESLLFQVHQSFEKQQSPEGQPWKELSTITKLMRRGTQYQILSDTTRLRSSIVFNWATKAKLEMGSNAKYARIQNEGGTIVAKTARGLVFGPEGQKVMVRSVQIPARPFIPRGPLPQPWLKTITSTMDRHLGRLG